MTGYEWFKTISAKALARALYNSGKCCQFCVEEEFNDRIDCVKTTTPENCIARTAEFFVSSGSNTEEDKCTLGAIKKLSVEALASWLIDMRLGCYFCQGCKEAPENSCELGVMSGLNSEQDIDKLADMVEIVDWISCD